MSQIMITEKKALTRIEKAVPRCGENVNKTEKQEQNGKRVLKIIEEKDIRNRRHLKELGRK